MMHLKHLLQPRLRYFVIVALCCALIAGIWIIVNGRLSAQVGGGSSSTGTFAVDVLLKTQATRTTFNRRLLGSNMLWIDQGSDLLNPGTLTVNAQKFKMLQTFAPTVLRYPGGVEADMYHWRNGTGTTSASRLYNDRYFLLPCAQMAAPSQGGPQTCGTCTTDADCAAGPLLTCIENVCKGYREQLLFGIREFLALARDLKAEPLFTVNVVTGTPQEAADLVRYVNISKPTDAAGRALPKITYWEIGNEPYLKGDRPGAALTPEVFAQRASATILAMRAVDPTIKVGIPVRNDKLAGQYGYMLEPTEYGDFTRRVLTGLTASFDFASVHDGYLPYGSGDDRAAYLAGAVSASLTQADIQTTLQSIKNVLPGWNGTIALTEWSPMFDTQPTDRMSSMAGMVNAADLLLTLAKTPNILMANQWSLTGNGYYGMLSTTGTQRVIGLLFVALAPRVNDQIVPTDITSTRTITTASSVGFVPSGISTSAVNALVLANGSTMTLVMVNKDPDAAATTTVRIQEAKAPSGITCKEMTASMPFAAPTQWSACTTSVRDNIISMSMPPRSVRMVSFTLVNPPGGIKKK